MPHTPANDGEPLAYAIAGEARGLPPILALHGLVSSDQHWRYFTPYYAARREVISWNYRGHGGAAAPRSLASVQIEQFADDGHAVWRATGRGPAIVVGLSFGVQVALELWRRHREAVRALILICGSPGHAAGGAAPQTHGALEPIRESPRLRAWVAGGLRALGGQPALGRGLLGLLATSAGRAVARELAFRTGGADRASCPPQVLDDLFRHVAGLDPGVVGAITASYFEHSAADVLASIDVPTLILAGDRDQLTPVATAERMQRAIPGSRLVVFPGHSHLVQVEDPDGVHRAIDAFLASPALA